MSSNFIEFLDLPVDIFDLLFSYCLLARDVLALSLTCKTLRTATSNIPIRCKRSHIKNKNIMNYEVYVVYYFEQQFINGVIGLNKGTLKNVELEIADFTYFAFADAMLANEALALTLTRHKELKKLNISNCKFGKDAFHALKYSSITEFICENVIITCNELLELPLSLEIVSFKYAPGDYPHITDNHIATFFYCNNNLRSAKFDGFYWLTNYAARTIPLCRFLEYVSFKGCNMTDNVVINYLSECKSLRDFDC